MQILEIAFKTNSFETPLMVDWWAVLVSGREFWEPVGR